MGQDNPNDAIPVEESKLPATISTTSAELTAELEVATPEEESTHSSPMDHAEAEMPTDQEHPDDETDKDELGAQPEVVEETPNASEATSPVATNVASAATSGDADDRSEIEKQPYNFDHCTVQIAIELLPDDGDANGRRVILGVRSHLDAPILRCIRWNELGTLPPLVSTLLNELRCDLPAREQAVWTALEKAKQEKEQRRAEAAKTQAQRRAERGRNKTTVQKNVKVSDPAKAQSANAAVPSAPTAPRAPLPTATAMEEPKQMGLF